MESTRLATDDPIDVARRYVDAVWNDRDLASLADLTSAAVVSRGTSFGTLEGRDAYREAVEIALAAFPALGYRVVAAAVEGDVVTLEWVATDGPSGRAVAGGETAVRLEGGAIAEVWRDVDPWLAAVEG